MENNNSDTNKNRTSVSYTKNSEDPSNTTHTKKTRKSRNARYKSKTESIHEKSGFTTLKLRVGQDVMQKLEEIYRDHRGYELNETRKDLYALSKVVSYCVSKFYKEMYLQKKRGHCLTFFRQKHRAHRSCTTCTRPLPTGHCLVCPIK